MSDNSTEMAEKLVNAGKKAEAQKTERRERQVAGAHLLETLRTRAQSRGYTITEQSGYLKVTSAVKGKQVYIAKKGGKVNFAGFTVELPGVTQITEEQAKAKHLGKVRGTLDFSQSDELVLAAYDAALDSLNTAPAEAPAAATAAA